MAIAIGRLVSGPAAFDPPGLAGLLPGAPPPEPLGPRPEAGPADGEGAVFGPPPPTRAAAPAADRLVVTAEAAGPDQPPAGAALAALPGRIAPDPVWTPSDFLGAGQTVVVIDDGWSRAWDQSALLHDVDFAGPNDPDASVPGRDSHGSWVAATVASVAPAAQIVQLKVFSEGSGTATFSAIEEALDFARAFSDPLAVAAVNISLGFGNATSETTTPISDELAALAAEGIPVTVAGGNRGRTYPEGVNVLAADANAVGVSATARDGGFAAFSQRDPDLTDIAAPGDRVEVVRLDGTGLAVSGTSFAAPAVAGAIARLQDAALVLTGDRLAEAELLDILQESAAPLAGVAEPSPPGWGALDADAAVGLFLERLGLPVAEPEIPDLPFA